MRVMIRMLRTTYRLSVTCTPTRLDGEPGGPMRKGMTYMVRPAMDASRTLPRRS